LNNIYFLLFSLLISSNLIAQSGFIVEETTVASFKMGSMKSSSHKYFSEDTYYSKMDFSFKGKGLARLMSRNMKNGTIISFQDSTIIKINHKKNRFTKTLLSEFLEEKNPPSDQENTGSNEEEESNYIVSDTIETVNGFKAYKITIQTVRKKIEGVGKTSGKKTSFEAEEKTIINSNYIWFTSEMKKSNIITSMQSKIDEFETNWINFDGNFEELGIDKDVIIVKAVFSDEEGSFEYNLNVYAPTDSLPRMFEVPEDYKKVKKL